MLVLDEASLAEAVRASDAGSLATVLSGAGLAALGVQAGGSVELSLPAGATFELGGGLVFDASLNVSAIRLVGAPGTVLALPGSTEVGPGRSLQTTSSAAAIADTAGLLFTINLGATGGSDLRQRHLFRAVLLGWLLSPTTHCRSLALLGGCVELPAV